MLFGKSKSQMSDPTSALPGRDIPIPVSAQHFVNFHALEGPYPEGFGQVIVGMGCFWGAERKFWEVPGVYTTAVGYSAGYTPNATYEEVCSGRTGHNEVVLVVYDPAVVTFEHLLKVFWETHNPTQGMRQGNDTGTQYRSGIYTSTPEQQAAALVSRDAYQAVLSANGYGEITTEIDRAGDFYFAEGYHQQYLAKNPGGYCGLGGTGVACPVGLATAD